jgi:hypothetical protein
VLIRNKFETLVTCHKEHVTHDTEATSAAFHLYTSWTTRPLLLSREHLAILRTFLDLLTQMKGLYLISQDGRMIMNCQQKEICMEKTV